MCLFAVLANFISPSFFFLCSKLNVLIYPALPNECVCFVLPVFFHNKVAESFVSSEKEESGGSCKRKALLEAEQSFKGNRN